MWCVPQGCVMGPLLMNSYFKSVMSLEEQEEHVLFAGLVLHIHPQGVYM